MNVVVYERAGGREICRQAVFEKGASATDNSLVGAGHSIVVESNYGYTGPTSVMEGRRTTPGVERIDIERDGRGCRTVWHSDETSPTVVPKLSLRNGLVYVYTQGEDDTDDPWYLTAIDFRTGKTAWKRLTGQGLGFNNNYAPVTIGPDGTAYVGVLGGLTLVRDSEPPAQAGSTRPKLRVTHRRGHVTVVAPSGGVRRVPVQGATVRRGKRVIGVTGRRGRVRARLRIGRNRVHASKRGYRSGRATFRLARNDRR
jgi:hypothetical protein